jgi:hypothetical protein
MLCRDAMSLSCSKNINGSRLRRRRKAITQSAVPIRSFTADVRSFGSDEFEVVVTF